MPQSFFELNLERRRRFLDEAARALGRSPVLLEKDIYVCWALQTLFALPAPVMVFKGGTSLSKVYRAIDRFSEDLDLTLDHRSSGDLLQDPVSASGNGRARFGERMKRYTAQQIEHVIKPHFEPHLASVGATRLEVVGAEREQLLLSYASPYGESYVLPQIRLEFGSKNATEPQESHLIQTDVLAWPVAAQLEFPSANVRVLSI